MPNVRNAQRGSAEAPRQPPRARGAACGPSGLPLGELEAGASAALAVLLALFGARVAGQVAGLLEGRPIAGLDLDERARDAVANGVRLARQSSTRDVDEDVELARGLGQFE